MNLGPVRWLARNVSTLLLALVLAMVVWISAQVTQDPNEVRTFTRPVTVVGQDSKLLTIGSVPAQARVTLRAPRSILNRLGNNTSLIQARIDLTGMGAGEHQVPVKITWDASANPTQLVLVEPKDVTLTLEGMVSYSLPVQLTVDGDPPLGFTKGEPTMDPAEVTISGRESQVAKVRTVRATLNVAGSGETVRTNVPVEALDGSGNVVEEVSISPRTLTVTQPITLVRGYKNVAVKVVTTGQIANGYRLTNISVTPLNVTVYSDNPTLVNELPGYVETRPVNLTGLNDDIEMRMELNLPKGISLVGEQSVLVQVSVAAIEGSLTVSLPVETLGLSPELTAHISPGLVDVIVTGPLPVLDTLTQASFRAVVDVAEMAPGVYQMIPVVDLVPDQVRIQTILPETVEVSITITPTPTATTTANPAATPSPTAPAP